MSDRRKVKLEWLVPDKFFNSLCKDGEVTVAYLIVREIGLRCRNGKSFIQI